MPELKFSFLGRLRIQQHEAGTITLTNRKAIGLLAYLVIESQYEHSREFLLGLLWPDLPTSAAQNNLRVTWAHLQKALRINNSASQPHLIADRLTLRFNPLSEHQLDVTHFNKLIEICNLHVHVDPNKCAECATRLTEALEIVRGDFLDDFALSDSLPFEEWLNAQKQSFREKIMSVIEQLATYHENATQFAEAESLIRRLLEYDRLNESAYRQLMRVLAAADRRSVALEVYETCRRLLVSEIGIAPTLETVTLAEQIRAHASPEANSAQALLPPVLTRFFGRKQESARLIDLLSRRTIRLVTLAGAGGVGKTRLTIEVANRMRGVFAHNICFVDLTGVTDEKSVDDVVAATLHLPTGSGRSSTSAILDYLRGKTLLLVLDNCEHLLKACVRLVQSLCREAEGLTVLATSRIPLHLEIEHVVRLEPFVVPTSNDAKPLTVVEALNFESVQLFTHRATQALMQFRLNDANVESVVRICQQLDGIPLALEIAAAQVYALPIATIAERLNQRFDWLNKRTAETIPRQRTLHALIDWSYGLLRPEARSLLLQLSVFAGGWTLEAAEAIHVPDQSTAELLAELVDHSLIGFGAEGEYHRYWMHETIRQFAREYLRGSEQELDAKQRHALYYAQLVSQAAENRIELSFAQRLQLVIRDHDNLRQAYEWLLIHERELALALVAQLGTKLKFWELGGFFQEGRRWLQRALEETQDSVSPQRGHALLAAADLSSAITDFEYGLQCVQQAQELFRQLGDEQGMIDAKLTYCALAELAGMDTNNQVQVEEALEMALRISYKPGIARGQRELSTIAYNANKPEIALQYCLPNIALWRELDNPFELARALTNAGTDWLEIGEDVAAREAFLEAQEIFRSLGYQRGVATALHNLGETAYRIGAFVSAREYLAKALRIRQHLGLPRGYPYSFELIAQVNEKEGRHEQAVQLLAVAETLRNRIGAPLEQVAQKHVDVTLASARSELGQVLFDLSWSKGATLTTEQAIALALG